DPDPVEVRVVLVEERLVVRRVVIVRVRIVEARDRGCQALVDELGAVDGPVVVARQLVEDLVYELAVAVVLERAAQSRRQPTGMSAKPDADQQNDQPDSQSHEDLLTTGRPARNHPDEGSRAESSTRLLSAIAPLGVMVRRAVVPPRGRELIDRVRVVRLTRIELCR